MFWTFAESDGFVVAFGVYKNNHVEEDILIANYIILTTTIETNRRYSRASVLLWRCMLKQLLRNDVTRWCSHAFDFDFILKEVISQVRQAFL